MNLPPFLMVQRPDNPDGQYILSTTPPFLMGHVWKFKKGDEHQNFLLSLDDYVKVPGYNIYIAYAGNMARSIPPTPDRAQDILRAMADFYFSFKIQPKEPKYRRYLDS